MKRKQENKLDLFKGGFETQANLCSKHVLIYERILSYFGLTDERMNTYLIQGPLRVTAIKEPPLNTSSIQIILRITSIPELITSTIPEITSTIQEITSTIQGITSTIQEIT